MVNGSFSPGLGGNDAPGRMSGTLSPALKFCAPQTIWRSPVPSLTRQSGELVGVGMLVARDDLRHDDAVERAGDFLHALDFEAEHGEPLGQFLGRPVEINVLFEPVKGDFHLGKLFRTR